MRHMRIVLLGTLILLFAAANPAKAQNDSLGTQNQTGNPNGLSGSALKTPAISPEEKMITSPIPEAEGLKRTTFSTPHTHLGKSFWISWGVLVGEAIADNELTAHCVQKTGCREANP